MKRRNALAHVLPGVAAFAVCSATPALTLADGAEVMAGVAPAAPPPAQPEPAASSSPPSPNPPLPSFDPSVRTAAFVLGGVAIAGAGAGIAFGIVALNEKTSFDERPTFRAASRANEDAVISDVCLGGAIVAAVTSIVLFVRSPREPSDAAPGTPGDGGVHREPSPLSFTVVPMITSHGGGAGAALRF